MLTSPAEYTIRVPLWLHRQDGSSTVATLTHRENRIWLEVADVGALRGLCADPRWRTSCESLARRGQRVDISHDGMHLASLGKTGKKAEGLTGSRYIAVGSWPGARDILGLPVRPPSIKRSPPAPCKRKDV